MHVPPNTDPTPLQPCERGVALVVALVMLTVILILGLSALRLTAQEERMTGYLLDRQLTFQAAEAALSEIENRVANFTPVPGAQCAPLPAEPGTVVQTCPAPAASAPARWVAINPAEWGRASPVGPANAQITPLYLVEYLGGNFPCASGTTAPQTCSQYRITVRAGGAPRAEVMLQSIYLAD